MTKSAKTDGAWPDCMIRTGSSGGAAFSCRGYGALLAERDALRARLAEAERDAVRYRWIRSRESGEAGWWHIKYNDDPAKIDAAIDAEMGDKP